MLAQATINTRMTWRHAGRHTVLAIEWEIES